MTMRADDITLKVLAEMAAENLKPKWRRVADSLPNNHQMCLCLRTRRDIQHVYEVLEYDSIHGWLAWDVWPIDGVTHWMPLPDLPTN